MISILFTCINLHWCRMENQNPSALHASYLSLKDWHVLLVSSSQYQGYHQGCWYHHQPLDDRSCNLLFKLSLAEIVEFGIRDSIWGTFAWFRKHLINIGAEADFIKIFVLNSHKDKGSKKDSLTVNTFTSTVCHDTSFQSASDLLLQNHFQLHILHFLPWLRRRPLQ